MIFCTNNRPRRGFTILEMLVALAIITLIGAVTINNRRLSSGMHVDIAARNIISLMREARGLAIASNESVLVRFDISRRTISSGIKNLALSEKQSLAVTASDEERVSAKVVGIRFFPTGRTTGGEIIISDGINSASIVVDWLFGDARLLKSSATP